MTLAPWKIDKGQRYQCEYREAGGIVPHEWKLCGYTVTLIAAERFCEARQTLPNTVDTRIIDREPWTHGELVVVDDGPDKPIYITSMEAHSGDVADLYHRIQGEDLYRKTNAVADAARIVKTWNAHDDLVRELTNFVNGIDTSTSKTLANVTRRSRELLDKLKT